MIGQCEFSERAAQPALVIRTRSAVQHLAALFGEGYGVIMAYLAEVGKQPAGMPFAAYLNQDMQDLELEFGFPVTEPLPGRGRIQPSELPGGTWCTIVHTGPYDQVGPAWNALAAAMRERQYSPAGPGYEFYYSEPGTPPAETRTLIGFPARAAWSEAA
jgi:effector-binding domain-containing protein